jgi:hypothetical protein
MSRILSALRTGLPALAFLAATTTYAAPGTAPAGTATPAKAPHVHASKLPSVLVHKSPTCSCCAKWVEHLREAGFTVTVDETDSLGDIKERVGIPAGKGSCHTAEVGGYFIEGHVPAQDIVRLVMEKPRARGLTAPGMPMGAPGMEMPDMAPAKYAVELVHADGSTEVFAEHGAKADAQEKAHDHAH